MPWQETEVVDQRTEFVLRVLRGGERFGDICREYGISRKTGYKWKERTPVRHAICALVCTGF
jgi:transposase-like protein